MTPKLDCLNLPGDRRIPFNPAATLVLAALLGFGMGHTSGVSAQTPAQTPAPASAPATPPTEAHGLAGTWQGTLHAGQDLRVVVKISNADGGGYKAVAYSIDQGGAPIPVATV